MQFIADYWDDRTKKLVPYAGTKISEWESLPREGMVRLTVSNQANGQTYSMFKRGCDWTFLYGTQSGAWIFGGWNNDERPSRVVLWRPGVAEQETYAYTIGVPDTGPIADALKRRPKLVKGSVWIPEPYATELGFSGGLSREDWEYLVAEEARAGYYDALIEEAKKGVLL